MLNDNAIFTAATGYVYIGDVGTPAPTRAQIRDFDPETFGANTHSVVVSGAPDGGTYTITVGGAESDPIAFDATAAEVQAALESNSAVGTGNVVVSGESAEAGYAIAFVGDLYGKSVEVSADGADLTGGSTPKAVATETSAANGWEPIGHTDEEELPEFGYEGGETEAKGSWQKKNLKEVSTENPVDYVTVKALQFDPATLELYYGKNDSNIEGVFGVNGSAKGGVEKAILIVMVDGLFKIGFSAAKSSVRRDESITLATDAFSTLPLRSTFIKHPGRHLFEWITPAA